jgi:hypothetical protein
MMPTSSIVIGFGTSLAAAAACGAMNADTSNCQMVRIDEWPVRLENNRLIIVGATYGHRIGILLDTGAMRTMVFRPAAIRLGPPLSPVFGTWLAPERGNFNHEAMSPHH